MSEGNSISTRVIAFFLPQFHPTPENNAAWGAGFTEWTNVTRAKPLFLGHSQPQLPTDLGFYDLRVPEVRADIAGLARSHGVYGFAYWHYWFGGGRRILERPIEEVLSSGEPDFPFCLSWANESWSGIWHGAPGRQIIAQTYGGHDDDLAHFNLVLRFFRDRRYITVDGKPVFIVYKPEQMPDAGAFIARWRAFARAAGLPGLHLVAIGHPRFVADCGFDAWMRHQPAGIFRDVPLSVKLLSRLETALLGFMKGRLLSVPKTFDYARIIRHANKDLRDDEYPVILPNWDTSPRNGSRATVLRRSTPKAFRTHVDAAFSKIQDRPAERKLVFLKSWNEWAEGNFMEPSREFGHAFLDVLREALAANDEPPKGP